MTRLGIEFGRPWVYSNTFTYIMLLPMCTQYKKKKKKKKKEKKGGGNFGLSFKF